MSASVFRIAFVIALHLPFSPRLGLGDELDEIRATCFRFCRLISSIQFTLTSERETKLSNGEHEVERGELRFLT